jgi:hypothetical protein
VGDLSGEHGFNLVLPSNTVLMFAPKVDMTDEVIKRLDQALPTVKVPDKIAQDEPPPAQPTAAAAGAKQP